MDVAYSPSLELEYLKKFGNCRCIKEFVTQVKDAIERLGFYSYGVTRLGATGEPEAYVKTVSDAMFKSYFEGGFFPYDLMVSALRSNNQPEPFYRSKILTFLDNVNYKMDIFDQNHEITRLLHSYGYDDLISIAEEATNKQGKILLTLTPEGADLQEFYAHVEEHKLRLRMLVRVIDYIGTSKFADYWLPEMDPKEIHLTPKPLELIRLMVQEDIFIDEAAEKLGKSRHVCNKQLRELKEKLEVKTLHGLSSKLTQMGLIN